MKAALDSHTDASLDAWRDDRSPPDTAEPAAARPGAACGVAAAPAAPERASSGSVSCDVLPRDLAGIDFQAGFADQIERLRAFVSQQSLLQAAPDGASRRRLWLRLRALVLALSTGAAAVGTVRRAASRGHQLPTSPDLRPPPPLLLPGAGSTLAPGVLSELAQLVGRSCQLCQAALRAEGVKVGGTCSLRPARTSGKERGRDRLT